ncbi:hypothetical protein ACA910_016006 [Epithemia clementina (nom. ined.)]
MLNNSKNLLIHEKAIDLVRATDYKAAAALLSESMGLIFKHTTTCSQNDNEHIRRMQGNEERRSNKNSSAVASLLSCSDLCVSAVCYISGTFCSSLSVTFLASSMVGWVALLLGRFVYLCGLADSFGMLRRGPPSENSDPAFELDAFVVDSCTEGVEGTTNTRAKEQDLNSFALFDKFLIGPSLSLKRASDYKLICCILLFNCGLSLHLRGVSTESEAFLKKALVTYETALDLVDSSAMIIGQGGRCLIHLLEVALLNNMGHIHNSLVATVPTQECLKRLLTALQTIGVDDNNEVDQNPLLHLFSFNIVCNERNFARPAPAA